MANIILQTDQFNHQKRNSIINKNNKVIQSLIRTHSQSMAEQDLNSGSLAPNSMHLHYLALQISGNTV